MFKMPLFVSAVSLGMVACVSNQYSQPTNLRFQKEQAANTQKIQVKRDAVLCAEDTADKQNCPIDFYIDSIQAGAFYINNSANYQLKPENYNFKGLCCTKILKVELP